MPGQSGKRPPFEIAVAILSAMLAVIAGVFLTPGLHGWTVGDVIAFLHSSYGVSPGVWLDWVWMGVVFLVVSLVCFAAFFMGIMSGALALVSRFT